MLPGKNYKNKSHLIWEIRSNLYEFEKQRKNVSLFWILVHVGIELNERVNRAAKDAIMVGTDTELLLLYNDFKAQWKDEMFARVHEWAQALGLHKGIRYFKNYFSLKRKSWFHKINIGRKRVMNRP